MKKTKMTKKKKSKKFVAFIKHPFVRKNKPLLHTIEWIFILLAFFSIGFPIIYRQSTENFLAGGKLKVLAFKGPSAPPSEAEKKFIGETIFEPVDTTGWDTYRNQWYGFEIKHPDSWTNLQYRTASAENSRYETIYKFRKEEIGENDPYAGFDVVIYSTKKISSVELSNEMKRMDDTIEDSSGCYFSEEMSLGEDGNKFQKISVGKGNACFEPAYFFSITNGNYMYDIVPVANETFDSPQNIEQDANQNFPEYKEAVASLKFIPISRPKPVAPKPKITAPRPVSAKVVGGRLVCAKKNDKPGKSQNGNKPGHMDMECCLDPDETPNPWCTYSNPKYQKYLK